MCNSSSPLYTILFLVLFAPYMALSQTLTGRVTGEGGALVGANISVKGTNKGTSTDVQGRYSIKLDPGTYEVVFTLIGFASRTETVSLKENEDRVLNVDLRSRAVETGEVVIVGARADSRTVVDSPLPIDVLTAKSLTSAGQNTFDKVLQYRVPSFNTVQTPVNDATALLDPYEIRNLGPGRTLVLINGKRKNSSALVYTQTSPGRGETGSDLSAIPLDAIKRIEILRDGASAQYGSDAIAGVMNIVLKDDADGGSFTLNSGITSEGDGARVGISVNNGSAIGNNMGFINYTIDLSKQNLASRSGKVDAEGEAADFGASLTEVNNFLALKPDAGNINGSPATSTASFLMNSGLNVSENSVLYANAAYVYKKVNSYANYRTPYWRTVTDFPYLADFFPNGPGGSYVGYLPTFDGDLIDYNATIGVLAKKDGWKFDVSFTTGYNSQDYTVINSHNRSDFLDTNGVAIYRENSPITFKPGGTTFSHQVGNIDISRLVTEKLSIGLGTEFRSETFEILTGDKASWDGIGADSYAGNRPENSGMFNRYNIGGYIDLGFDATKEFLINATIRNEYYSDFGDAFVYRVSSRYRAMDVLTLRGSYSTGFKAPTLHQIYTQRSQYSFVPGAGVQSIGLVNNVSPQAKLLGVKKLQPEKSRNLTLGFGLVTDILNLTFDYYNIAVDDRIVISNRVTTSSGEFEFFTNSINTRTTGIDVVVSSKGLHVGEGVLGLSVAGNVTLSNRRVGDILKVKGTPVIDETQEALFFTSRPKQKVIFGADYEIGRTTISIVNTYFGKTEFRQVGMSKDIKTVFQPKVVTDANVRFGLFGNITLALNVNNVLDILPKWKFEALNSDGTTLLADPAMVKVQSNLITFNQRYPIMSYDGYHFSQLGRLFSASLTYHL